MITDEDVKKLSQTFVTKDDLKKALEESNKSILKGVAVYLESAIIRILNDHEKRIDRLEKSVGGFPPIAS